MSAGKSLPERLAGGPPLLLDGATGTELQRRGVTTDVPQWSAVALETAPDVVRAIHADYVAAGAEILTANTFRTHRLNLAAAGRGDRARELTSLAVQLAREAAAAATRPVWIAGSQAPIADCYTPLATPDDDLLAAEHARMAEQLAAAGVDLILVETHPTLREALAATRAAVATGLPVIASVVCNPEGRLLSGESLGEAAGELGRLPVAAVCVNCIVAESLQAAIEELARSGRGRPVGGYANISRYDPPHGWVDSPSRDPTVYREQARGWLRSGARLVGGCCGTTPAHIRELRSLLDGAGEPS